VKILGFIILLLLVSTTFFYLNEYIWKESAEGNIWAYIWAGRIM
jgi:hypothetical protein